MREVVEIDKIAFTFICIFAVIGALVVAVILIYIICGILDLTYHERHKKRTTKSDCPEKIEKGGSDDEIQ